MKKLSLFLAFCTPLFFTGPAVQAQTAERPIVARAQNTSSKTFLPANTKVLLRMNNTLTTKNKRYREGDTFYMTVVHDILLKDFIVIPKDSRATGEITWMTGKGMFGKSGKMDISLKYIDVDGRPVPIRGTFRQEGEGNTVATVGGVILAGPFAAFITGKSGVIPAGRELEAHTTENIPVSIPDNSKPSPFEVAIDDWNSCVFGKAKQFSNSTQPPSEIADSAMGSCVIFESAIVRAAKLPPTVLSATDARDTIEQYRPQMRRRLMAKITELRNPITP